MTIPTAIAALLPFLATALSSWLSDDHLPQKVNALIALAAIVLTAISCELLAGNFTGNWAASFLGTLGYVTILMQGDLSVLYQYLVAKPSPLKPQPPAPQPIVLPPTKQGSA